MLNHSATPHISYRIKPSSKARLRNALKISEDYDIINLMISHSDSDNDSVSLIILINDSDNESIINYFN